VRSRRSRADAGRGLLAATIARHPREFVGLVMAAATTVAIFVNALFLQSGPHPAPIFATRPFTPLPRPHPVAAPAPAPTASARSQVELVSEIQRALAARGFYQGTVDGIWGAKTDLAARQFAQAAGLTIDPAPNEKLLRAITAAKTASPQAPAASPAPARSDPIAALLAPSKRVLAIQRALADFGYGQIKPTGVVDAETRSAIEKFERDHGMPADGQISEGFVRALAAMSGRPLD
jgi:peptidoglycan hydrolase-like protein with peptidoglycan-binding domain